MKEENPFDLMKELADESVEALTELIQEEIAPLIQYRAELEKKIGNKEIRDMHKMEQEV